MSESKRPDITGMHSYIFFSHSGVPIECYFDHQPHEPQTMYDPGANEVLELVHAFIGDHDILDIMEQSIKCLIETVALAKMQEERIDDDHRIEFPRPSKDYRSFASFLG